MRRLPMPLLVLLLFVGSGCAALIDEVVWFQLLQLVIGSSVISLGVLLGTFMGGMCLGSLLLPRLVPPRQHPLRVYAALEPRLRDAPINTDRNLRLQYLAGLGLKLYRRGQTYAEMLSYRRMPVDLFTGSDGLKNAVMARIQAAGP